MIEKKEWLLYGKPSRYRGKQAESEAEQGTPKVRAFMTPWVACHNQYILVTARLATTHSSLDRASPGSLAVETGASEK